MLVVVGWLGEVFELVGVGVVLGLSIVFGG